MSVADAVECIQIRSYESHESIHQDPQPQQCKRRADITANAPLVATVRRSARANTKAQQDRTRNGERLSQRKCMHVYDVAIAA